MQDLSHSEKQTWMNLLSVRRGKIAPLDQQKIHGIRLESPEELHQVQQLQWRHESFQLLSEQIPEGVYDSQQVCVE
jgi:hypothetical protein